MLARSFASPALGPFIDSQGGIPTKGEREKRETRCSRAITRAAALHKLACASCPGLHLRKFRFFSMGKHPLPCSGPFQHSRAQHGFQKLRTWTLERWEEGRRRVAAFDHNAGSRRDAVWPLVLGGKAAKKRSLASDHSNPTSTHLLSGPRLKKAAMPHPRLHAPRSWHPWLSLSLERLASRQRDSRRIRDKSRCASMVCSLQAKVGPNQTEAGRSQKSTLHFPPVGLLGRSSEFNLLGSLGCPTRFACSAGGGQKISHLHLPRYLKVWMEAQSTVNPSMLMPPHFGLGPGSVVLTNLGRDKGNEGQPLGGG